MLNKMAEGSGQEKKNMFSSTELLWEQSHYGKCSGGAFCVRALEKGLEGCA